MPKRRITFTRHAETVCAERLIALEWIERTIAEPEEIETDAERPTVMRAYRRIPERDGRTLRVVYVEGPEAVRVITAFFDRSRR